jgi:hypothetical protein
MVLVPLAYLIFIFRLAALSIGQQTLWISFTVFATIVAVFSLAMRREVRPKESAIEIKYPTRLQTWINTVQRKEYSPYFKWNLAQDLSNLLIEAIAYHQGTSQRQICQQLESGKIDLPPDILAYLQISQKPFTHTGLSNYATDNCLIQIWEAITKHPISNKAQSPLDLEHEKIISYLEEYLNFDTHIQEG